MKKIVMLLLLLVGGHAVAQSLDSGDSGVYEYGDEETIDGAAEKSEQIRDKGCPACPVCPETTIQEEQAPVYVEQPIYYVLPVPTPAPAVEVPQIPTGASQYQFVPIPPMKY